MKNFVRSFLCLMLCMMLPAMSFAQVPVTNTACKYAGQGGTCEIKYWVDTENRMHCEACFYHVEEKEDSFSHVPVTDWTPCTLDNGGECIVCGADYVKDSTDDGYNEAYMTEYFIVCIMEGTSPLDITVSGNVADVEFSEAYLEKLDANGIAVSETLSAPTTYTLSLSSARFEYAGSPITPATLGVSSYGPGSWAQELGYFTVSSINYTNNDEPGTATATVTLTVGSDKVGTLLEKQLSAAFTITGEKEEEFTEQELTSDEVKLAGLLDKDASISVTVIDDSDSGYQTVIVDQAAEGKNVIAAYDVDLSGAFEGELDLTFPVDEEHNGKTVTVLHGKADDTVEVLTDVAKNGEITVTVTELSPFILLVAEEEEDVKPVPPVTPDQPQQPENPEVSESPAAPSVPKTGDSSMPMLWLALMALSAAGFAFTAKKRFGSR